MISELVTASAARLLGGAGNCGGFTVREAVEGAAPAMAAVIVVVPCPRLVARPCEPGVLLMVATAVFDELQVTARVPSWGPPAPKGALALTFCVPAKGMA